MLLLNRRTLLMFGLLLMLIMQLFNYAVASVSPWQMLPQQQHQTMQSDSDHCSGMESADASMGCHSMPMESADCCNEMENCVTAHCLSVTACPDTGLYLTFGDVDFQRFIEPSSVLLSSSDSLYRPPITA